MPQFANNVFHRLHKWAARQDENFLTESLALVVEQLLILAPEAGTRLISKLTGGFLNLPAGDASTIEIRTQVETGQGRPDLEIRAPNRLVWIEVKVESPLRAGQLEGYRVALAASEVESNRLILLTRYPEKWLPGDERPDAQLRWFEVADWLEAEFPVAIAAGEVAGFLVEQLFDFLKEKNMTLAQVGKYMPEGLKAMSNLMNMLVEAANFCKVSVIKKPRWDNTGLELDGKRYWVGVNHDEPEYLYFSTDQMLIDVEAANRLPVGKTNQSQDVPGGTYWLRWIELDSEDVHFFARSKISQMEWLEQFLKESIEIAKTIERPVP
jgi:hypothetical protein